MLRRLAVFPTHFDLDAAAAVAAGDGIRDAELPDALTRLVDRGLIDYHHDADRYRMLETLRQFGLERLRDAAELQLTRQRYATYWAERAGDPYQPETLAAMLTDVFATIDWAMVEDSEMADRILSQISPQCFGLNHWPDLDRACAWLLADRPRGRAGRTPSPGCRSVPHSPADTSSTPPSARRWRPPSTVATNRRSSACR